MNYLYRHIRHDKNEVFYVGIGASINRAFSEKHRNRYWHHIVRSTTYDVEIMYESESSDFIREKEKEFIKLYGRKDLGLGTLANLNDGGEGLNKSKESIQKQLSTAKANGNYDKMVERIRGYKNISKGADSYKAKTLYCYNINGLFNKKYDTYNEASEDCGVSRKEIYESIKNHRITKKFIFSNTFLGNQIDPFGFRNTRYRGGYNKYIKVCPVSNKELAYYRTIREISNEIKAWYYTIKKVINTETLFHNFIWRGQN